MLASAGEKIAQIVATSNNLGGKRESRRDDNGAQSALASDRGRNENRKLARADRQLTSFHKYYYSAINNNHRKFEAVAMEAKTKIAAVIVISSRGDFLSLAKSLVHFCICVSCRDPMEFGAEILVRHKMCSKLSAKAAAAAASRATSIFSFNIFACEAPHLRALIKCSAATAASARHMKIIFTHNNTL